MAITENIEQNNKQEYVKNKILKYIDNNPKYSVESCQKDEKQNLIIKIILLE